MTVFKLIAKASGVSSKSGKAWYMVTLRGTENGKSAVDKFFVSEAVWRSMQNDSIEEDSAVLISAELGANMRFAITMIEKAEN